MNTTLNEPERALCEALVDALVEGVGGGFHPDTPALDYTVAASGLEPVYGDAVVAMLDVVRSMLFLVLGEAFYELANDSLRKRLS